MISIKAKQITIFGINTDIYQIYSDNTGILEKLKEENLIYPAPLIIHIKDQSVVMKYENVISADGDFETIKKRFADCGCDLHLEN